MRDSSGKSISNAGNIKPEAKLCDQSDPSLPSLLMSSITSNVNPKVPSLKQSNENYSTKMKSEENKINAPIQSNNTIKRSIQNYKPLEHKKNESPFNSSEAH